MRFVVIAVLIAVGLGVYLYSTRHPPAAPLKKHAAIAVESHSAGG